MNKLVISAIAAIAFGVGPALSADLPPRPPMYKAPPPPPMVTTWTGCYIGVNGGGAWGRTRTTGNWGNLVVPGNSIGNDIDGGFVGGQVGCDYQIQNNWVIGAEATGDWADIEGSVANAGGIVGHTLRHRINGFATFTGRLGYTQDRWMIYAKGGAAWANMDYTSLFAGCPGGVCSVNGDKWGWTIGAGLEYMLWSNWSAKVEYQYLDFRSDRVGFGGFPGIFSDTDARVHTIKAALNWHWGGPLSARY